MYNACMYKKIVGVVRENEREGRIRLGSEVKLETQKELSEQNDEEED